MSSGVNSVGEEVWTCESLEDPHGQPDKARRVRAMFDAIARRYELANRIISFGQVGRWRRGLARMLAEEMPVLTRGLDLCCGTGGMIHLLRAQYPGGQIFGADFSVNMLRHADPPFPRLGADALALPFGAGVFDAVTCTFGFRNFQSFETGLREIHRVLRPGGALGALEFQIPPGRLGSVFGFYFDHVLPLVGGLVASAGRSRAYRYLPKSVRSWHDGNSMIELIRRSGFHTIRVRRFGFGSVWALTAKA